MILDRPLKIAFIFSIGVHSLLLSPILSLPKATLKNNTKIEVTYLKIPDEPLNTRPIPLKDDKVSIKKEKKTIQKEMIQPKAAEEEGKTELEKKFHDRKESLQKKISYTSKIIDLDSISFQSGQSNALNYLRAIRNKINLYVHSNYESHMGNGEALLHFVLKKDGSVQSASIISDNMGTNSKLRNLCKDSIYLSSPFKPFPKNLALPQAAFNISISFK